MSLNHITENSIQTLAKNAMLSKEETERKYRNDPRYTSHQIAQDGKKERIKAWIKKERELHPDISETDFIKTVITEYNSPILHVMIDEFNNLIPNEKIQKLIGLTDKDNIKVINDANKPDMNTDIETGKIEFNLAKLNDVSGKTLEDQMVTILGRIIHEALKLVVNIRKGSSEKDALIKYKLTSGKIISLPEGSAGKMLEIGYIERLAADFAERNGIYYEMDPLNIPMADLCTYMMNSSNILDNNYMMNNDYEHILQQIDPREAEIIKEAENVAILTHGNNDAVLGNERIEPEVIEETWREDPAKEELDPDALEEAVEEVDPSVPSVTDPANKDKKTEDKQEEVLDAPIEEVDPEEYEEIKNTNIAYLEEHPLEAEKEDSLDQKSKENNGPVLKMMPLNELPGYKDSEGFISILTLISVIAAFSSILLAILIYIINK